MSPLNRQESETAEYTVYGLIPLQSSVHGVSLSQAMEFIQHEQHKARSIITGEHVTAFVGMTKDQIEAILQGDPSAESGIGDCGMVGFRRKSPQPVIHAETLPAAYEPVSRSFSHREPVYA